RHRHPGRKHRRIESARVLEIGLGHAAIEGRENARGPVVPAAFRAPEGKSTACTDRTAIPVEKTGVHATPGGEELRAVGRHDRSHESEVTIIYRSNRVLEALDRIESNLGPEDLIPLIRMILSRVREPYETGSDKGGGQRRFNVDQALAAGFFGESPVAEHLGVCGVRDKRAHEYARLKRRADPYTSQDPRQTFGEGVEDRRFDEDPARRGAALPGRGADGDRRFGYRELEIGVAQDDDRVLAAELEGHELPRLVEHLTGKLVAYRPRAGEEDRVHIRVEGQEL